MRIVMGLALLLTALCLVPSGAHLLEMPHKMTLAQADYLAVQQIYRGWAFAGIVLVMAVIVDLVLAVMLRGQGLSFGAAGVGLVLVAITLVTFFVYIYPVNAATSDWTVAPPGWEDMRMRWEYTHAINAVLTFCGLVALVIAALNLEFE